MKNYNTTHTEKYEKPNRRGYLNLPVLEFLKGHKWDDVSLGYVHSLRPSAIRVVTDYITCDVFLWRVTVYVNYKDVIQKIIQEVEVGLPEGVAHGEALYVALDHGIDSEECKKYLDYDFINTNYINPNAYREMAEKLKGAGEGLCDE